LAAMTWSFHERSVERGVARAGPGSPGAERGNAARVGAPGWLEVFAEAMVVTVQKPNHR